MPPHARLPSPQFPSVPRGYVQGFLRLVAGGLANPAQGPSMSLVALVNAADDWRLASAAILPRALLATELAPLSHMLMNGFFFIQGLDIYCSSVAAVPRPWSVVSQWMSGRFRTLRSDSRSLLGG